MLILLNFSMSITGLECLGEIALDSSDHLVRAIAKHDLDARSYRPTLIEHLFKELGMLY